MIDYTKHLSEAHDIAKVVWGGGTVFYYIYNDGTYKCGWCDETFMGDKALYEIDKHFGLVHGKEYVEGIIERGGLKEDEFLDEVFWCSECRKKFIVSEAQAEDENDDFLEHVRAEHGVDIELNDNMLDTLLRGYE